MKNPEHISVLLQDIKSILYGIAWLILGGIFCLGGLLLMLAGHSVPALLLLFPGVIVCIAGILYARYGGRQHSERAENSDE